MKKFCSLNAHDDEVVYKYDTIYVVWSYYRILQRLYTIPDVCGTVLFMLWLGDSVCYSCTVWWRLISSSRYIRSLHISLTFDISWGCLNHPFPFWFSYTLGGGGCIWLNFLIVVRMLTVCCVCKKIYIFLYLNVIL